MIILSKTMLRSLRNEASRQGEFFWQRDSMTAAAWFEIESLSHEALQAGTGLSLILSSEKGIQDPIINLCEQHQQPQKGLQ